MLGSAGYTNGLCYNSGAPKRFIAEMDWAIVTLLGDIAGGTTRSLTGHLRRANPLVIDALIAIAFASIAVVDMQGAAESDEGFRDSDGLGALLVLSQTLPLVLRRVAPLGSLAVIVAGIGLHSALGYDEIGAGTLASLVAVSSAAYVTDNRRALVAALLGAVAIGVFFATTRTSVEGIAIFWVVGVWSAGWIVGNLFRTRRIRLESTEQVLADLTERKRVEDALRESESKLRQSEKRELALAGQIQANFLPDTLPDVPGWQLAAMLEPARETSGDFYDIIPLPSGRLGILIADVADKGMGAALFMALSRTLIRTYAVEYDTQPELALSAANRRILADTHAGLFVTVFYGVLDTASGELTYSNAGHNPPYLLNARDGDTVQELDRTGVPLGILDGGTWQQGTAHIAPGDVLLLYTDGITEAQNAQEDFFDEERLREVVRANLGRSARDIQDSVIAQVGAFVGDAPQSDDITLMVVVRGPTESLLQ